MTFVGRSRELGALRGQLDRESPAVVRIFGLSGVGKSTLVRQVAVDYDGVVFTCPPLPDAVIRAGLARETSAAAAADGRNARAAESPGSTAVLPDADWPALFDHTLSRAREADRPWVLVLDDAHRLTEARARWLEPARETLASAVRNGIALHLVLVGRAAGLPDLAPFEEVGAATTTVLVPPLDVRAAAELLPGADASATLRAYGVFGGIPGVLARLDHSVTVGTNVRRLFLDPDSPLRDGPLAWLEREVQTPARYLALLRTMTSGEADWSALHAGLPGLTRSGQLGPYLNRLVELGMVEARRSLDAAPRSRGTRYALTDPFLAFWLRFVLPWRMGTEVHRDRPPLRAHYAESIRPEIPSHLDAWLPAIARRHMENAAIESIGVPARACGSLWGTEYEIPVAGMLSNGAAFYGISRWAYARSDPPLDALDAAIRETRWGFGRQGRLRVVFTGRSTPTWLRRQIARRTDAVLVDAEALVGG